MEKLSHETHKAEETWTRSIVKTVSYRIFIIILDFGTIYLLTGKTSIAAGFTLISNVYTTIAYLIHERVWTNVKWGKVIYKK